MTGPPPELLEAIAGARADPAAVHAWLRRQGEVDRYRRPSDEDEPDTWYERYLEWKERYQALIDAINVGLDRTVDLSAEDPARAARAARIMLELCQLLDGPDARLRVSAVAGHVLLDVGAYFDAAEAFTEAVSVLDAASSADSKLAAEVRGYHLQALHADQRWDDLGSYLPLFEEVVRSQCLRGLEAAGLRVRAHLAEHVGNAEAAVSAMEQAVRLRRSLTPDEESDEQQLVVPLDAYLGALGQLAGQTGRLALAETTYLELVERLERAGGGDIADALRELAMIYHYMGDNARAARTFHAAAERATKDRDRQFLQEQARLMESVAEGVRVGGVARMGAGEDLPPVDARSAVAANNRVIQMLLDHDEEGALALGAAILDYVRSAEHIDLELSVRNSLGVAARLLRRFPESRKYLVEGIRLADKRRRYATSIGLRQNLAETFFDAEDYSSGMTALTSALDLTLYAWHAAETSHHRQELLAGLADLFDRYALTTAAGEDFAAFVAGTELARSRNAQEWIIAERLLPSSMDDPVAREARLELRRLRAVDVELEIRHITGAAGAREVNALAEERRHLLDDLDAALGERSLTLEATHYRRHARDNLRALVHAHDAVLVLYAIDASVCWSLVTGDTEIDYVGGVIHWPREARTAAVATLTGTAFDDDDDDSSPIAAADALIRTSLDMLAPLVEALRTAAPSRLSVVSHEELAFLPFWAIADAVGTVASLRLAPSIAVLRLCAERPPAHSDTALLVVDETGDLPYAQLDRELLRSTWPGSLIEPRTSAVLFDEASTCAVLHVSGHGMFYAANPYWSGFLGPPDSRKVGLLGRYLAPDGALSAFPAAESHRVICVAECLATLAMPECEVAVLSACESGVARLHGGGELTGLPNALLVAGCRAVVASMWPVHDAAGALLIHHFYDEWLASGRRHVAAALAVARQRLRATTRAQAATMLGDDTDLPPGDRPFDHAVYSDVFHAFGAA